MKHSLSLVSILLSGLCHLTQAQTWCPSGAEWTLSYNSVDWSTGETANGILLAQYVGDTVIGGQAAKKITQQLTYQIEGNDEYLTDALASVFTRYADDVVYMWNTGSAQFDTLLWFGAAPGEEWPVVGLPPEYRFTVLNTSTADIAGIPLRRSVVQLYNLDTPLFIDTLYERIGFTWINTFQPGGELADGLMLHFLCYHDADIAYPDPGPLDCGFTMNVSEPAAATIAWLYPNPGSNVLHIETGTSSQTDVHVFDGMGREVLMATDPAGTLEISTAGLVPGIYLVEVTTKAGRRTVKWIKE